MRSVAFITRHAIVVVLAFTGCATDQAPAHSADADVDRCARALLEMQEKAERRPGGYDYLPDYVASCGWVYARAECKKAWEEAAQQDAGVAIPDPRVASLAGACKKSYCADLDAPKPAYCARTSELESDTALYTEWPMLHRAILRKEIAAEPALLAALQARFAPIFLSTSVPSDLPKAAGGT